MLPPTTFDLTRASSRPYFLWWVPNTVGEFKAELRNPDLKKRAYWLGALLREANTRDVWLFTNREQIESLWVYLIPHLGKRRNLWAWLLDKPEPVWPPRLVQDDGA